MKHHMCLHPCIFSWSSDHPSSLSPYLEVGQRPVQRHALGQALGAVQRQEVVLPGGTRQHARTHQQSEQRQPCQTLAVLQRTCVYGVRQALKPSWVNNSCSRYPQGGSTSIALLALSEPSLALSDASRRPSTHLQVQLDQPLEQPTLQHAAQAVQPVPAAWPINTQSPNLSHYLLAHHQQVSLPVVRALIQLLPLTFLWVITVHVPVRVPPQRRIPQPQPLQRGAVLLAARQPAIAQVLCLVFRQRHHVLSRSGHS